MTEDDYEPPSEDELMGAEQFREFLKETAEESVGTRDLGEANRRWSVLNEWRYQND